MPQAKFFDKILQHACLQLFSPNLASNNPFTLFTHIYHCFFLINLNGPMIIQPVQSLPTVQHKAYEVSGFTGIGLPQLSSGSGHKMRSRLTSTLIFLLFWRYWRL